MENNSQDNTFRILSYNLHKGFAFGNNQFLLEEMRHSIRMINADIVFLQEVVGENTRHRDKHKNWTPQQFEFLADEVWPHYAYGKNAIYSHGHHGNAILSKHPFSRFDNLDVSFIPTSQRGILFGRTTNHINVFCVHFGLLGLERRAQIRTLCKHITSTVADDEALIICGDFNDWTRSADRTLKKALQVEEALSIKRGKSAATFPAFAPLLAMDRVYFRNLKLLDAEVLSGHPWDRLSDHCALYAEFSQPE